MSTERTPEDIADDILREYDLAVDDVSLDDAIETCEAILSGIEIRLGGLESDRRRRQPP